MKNGKRKFKGFAPVSKRVLENIQFLYQITPETQQLDKRVMARLVSMIDKSLALSFAHQIEELGFIYHSDSEGWILPFNTNPDKSLQVEMESIILSLELDEPVAGLLKREDVL